MTKRRSRLAALAAALLLTLGVAAVSSPGTAGAEVLSARCFNDSADSATINNTINNSSVNDVIEIHGTCSLTSTVVLRDSRTYQGDGKGATVLRQASGANLKALVATRTWVNNDTFTNLAITLRDLTIDANKAQNTMAAGGGALVLRTWDSDVENVEVKNSARDGILISSPSDNGTLLSGSSVNSTVRGFFVSGSGESGVRVADAGGALTDWTLQDGWVASSGPASPAVRLDNAAGWEVHNLHVYGVGTDAMVLNRCYATRVSDNYVEEFGAQGTNGTAYHGIVCNAQGDASSTITGNTVHHFGALPAGTATYEYIRVEANYNTPVVSVTGNTIRGTATGTRETGLVYSTGGASAMTVGSSGNTTFNVNTARTNSAGVTVTAGQ